MSVGLQPFDQTWGKELRHKSPSIADDNFETPWEDYYSICKRFKLAPMLDAFATHQNSKCLYELTKAENAFVTDWLLPDGTIPDVFVNHPHTEHPLALWRCENQFQKFNMNIIMMLPRNVGRTIYYHQIIEQNRFTLENQIGHIHAYPYWNTIRFLKNGKKSEETSRNAYDILIWRRKKNP